MQSSPVSVLTRFEDKPALLFMTVVRLWSRFDVVAHVRDLGHVGLIIIYNDDVRGGRGGEDTARCVSAATEAGLRCPTSADRHVGVEVWE